MESSHPTSPVKTLYFGTPLFSSIILKSLIASPLFRIIGLITRQEKPQGRHHLTIPSPTRVVAEENEIPVFFDVNKDDLIKHVQKVKPDLIIVAAYGRILPTEIISYPRFGSLNIHPSLLPKYRGPSPIQASLLAGDSITGVSVIKMNEKMDEGDIIIQRSAVIEPNDTGETLTNRLAALSGQLLIEAIPAYLTGSTKLIRQDHSQASYCKLITKSDGEINWEETPDVIRRKIYALYPWPCAWTIINKQIYKFIPDNRIQPAGKRIMTMDEFLRGNPGFILPKLISW